MTRLPHARGGVSVGCGCLIFSLWSSPRPWGCFYPKCRGCVEGAVFPTPVGVFPPLDAMWRVTVRLPHARGGVSRVRSFNRILHSSSPRPWGCFYWEFERFTSWEVFPTPVGVFLNQELYALVERGLPHARGGVSLTGSIEGGQEWSSPRPWGCFWLIEIMAKRSNVFPTPVGVFPNREKDHESRNRLPHARGGVSLTCTRKLPIWESSPRPWGCFPNSSHLNPSHLVFPTPVGVFLDGSEED